MSDIIWKYLAYTWEFGTYISAGSQVFGEPCTNVQARQSLCCLHTHSMEVEAQKSEAQTKI